jgi:hypothetical protein
VDTEDGLSPPSSSILAFATGLPTAKLVTQFVPDDSTTGDYTITFKMNNGNTQQQFVEVIEEAP